MGRYCRVSEPLHKHTGRDCRFHIGSILKTKIERKLWKCPYFRLYFKPLVGIFPLLFPIFLRIQEARSCILGIESIAMLQKCITFASDSRIRGSLYLNGEMAEWSIAAVLKTVELRGSGGSNPSLSANKGVNQ